MSVYDRPGWRWAAVVWGYAIIWFLLTDRMKLAAYRFLGQVKTHSAVHAGGRSGP